MNYAKENAEHFASVLQAAGFGEYQKTIAEPHYNDAIEFMIDAGVTKEVALSPKSVGCASRYILDVYNCGGSDVKLSTFFFQRLSQLQSKCQGGDA